MAPSSGRIVKFSKRKRGTAHQKNHRWESFTTKISKLSSLDPLRRVRRGEPDTGDLAATTSYFKNGLEKWQELNLSESFIDFAHKVTPLCDSLPQMLHFEDRIMGLLAIHLQMQKEETMEPILELLVDFARDLGVRFEKHYSRALELVISIARTFHSVDVIEWSFACLTFMFKYLSKLLVLDLRPTYDLMAPLLGRKRQKPHIARFAAEAMSYLIKKAAAPAVRERALDTIIQHAKSDLYKTIESREYGLYYHGLMTMFAEAAKGSRLSIHSSGPAIIHSMFTNCGSDDSSDAQSSIWVDVICGVLTSLIHHSNSDTFKDLMTVILEKAEDAVNSFEIKDTAENFQSMMLSAKTIAILAGVRKGSRVSDWNALLSPLSKMLAILTHRQKTISDKTYGNESEVSNIIVLSTSIVLQCAPMEALIPFVHDYLTALSSDPLSSYFLVFCSYFAEAEVGRFRSIVLPYFQKFIIAHWSDLDNEDTLCILIPKMVHIGALMSGHSVSNAFRIPQSWQDQIVSKFERLEATPFPEQASVATTMRDPKVWHDRCLPSYGALLEILECTTVHPSTNARIAEIIFRKLKLALRPSSTLALSEAHFIVGRGFKAFCRMVKDTGDANSSLGALLRAAAPRFSRLPTFLEAMIAYDQLSSESPTTKDTALFGSLDASKFSVDSDETDNLLVASLIDNLSTEQHETRLLSLQLLDRYQKHIGKTSEVLATMLLIEHTPLDLQNSRVLSMHLRTLASMYRKISSDPLLRRAVPSFCFGMLTVRLSKLWEDACAALVQIAEIDIGEAIIAEIAFQWLEKGPRPSYGSRKDEKEARNEGLTDFECSNLMKLEETFKNVQMEIKNAQTLMLQEFTNDQQLVADQPSTARSQAVRVLLAIPKIAERRSRQFVPTFLSWAGRDKQLKILNSETITPMSNWTKKEQKAQLDLFSLFQNPKVLYRSADIYNALLSLLTNGDTEMQKSALKAIFTWKLPSIMPYEENLSNLMDGARFNDEISLLLRGQTLIQPQHRAELMPVLLRLLYGRTVSKKGLASGKQGMEARRSIVLRHLAVEDMDEFLSILLGELSGVRYSGDNDDRESVFKDELMSIRRQVGFMKMMEDFLKELGLRVEPFTFKILPAILYCLVSAARQLQRDAASEDGEESGFGNLSMLRVIRQTGFKCLNYLFINDAQFDWGPFIASILEELVCPRIDKLPTETGQAVSGVLQLLWTWSSSPRTVLFLGRDDRILPKVAECLAQQKSKDEVKLFALGIISNIMKLARSDTTEVDGFAATVKSSLLDKNMEAFLVEIGNVLRNQHASSKDLLQGCVETLSELASFVSQSAQAYCLVDISIFLLDEPARRVNPKTKNGLLQVLERFVPLYDLQDDSVLKDKIFNTVTSLFGYFRDRLSRQTLSRLLELYCQADDMMNEVAELCAHLNSYKDTKLDEPDYDKRLQAFLSIMKLREIRFTARQWRPLLFNLLYFIKHEEEFGILSSNSADGICKFLDDACIGLNSPENQSLQSMLSSIVLPAIYSGIRERSEVIRREYLKVMAHVVRNFRNLTDVSDMYSLLGGDDELESSFFSNIITTGKGRQSCALGQLAAAAEKGKISSHNVNRFFIPLIEHFIFDRADGSDAHNLAAEATTTLGLLASSLEWPQYRALLTRFIGYISSKPELEKQVIRLLNKVVDALAMAAEQKANGSQDVEGVSTDVIAQSSQQVKPQYTLTMTLPGQVKLMEALTSSILPQLITYLHDKEESTVSLRAPVAVAVVKLLKLLPQQEMVERLPAVLTDVCHILLSRSQESRDITRDALTKICLVLGPACFGFVLKELRGALTRGYQLHVLSYTMHSILVATTPEHCPGDLDYCLSSIVAIIMDDIFGVTGQEKDAEEYISKMKEVKSSKSHDSMELIASTATLNRLTDIMRPIQVLLGEKLNLRTIRKIDDLLKRVCNGLLRNSAAQSRESLVFCYELIKDVYANNKSQSKVKEDHKLKKYLIQRGASRSENRGGTTIYTYKLIRFALDVMRSVLKKYDSLRTASNIAGFIPILGDALVQAEDEIKIATFRLLDTIAKVPLQSTENGTKLFQIGALEALKSIVSSTSTTSDISQEGLKLLSVLLRDRNDIKIKESSIDDVLKRLKDDLTDPERRDVIFRFLRALLGSKVESATVYDTLDYVGTVMITNDDNDTRKLARGAYIQFLLEYPQTKKSWKKRLDVIIANLEYDREGGRLSVLEVINLLLLKSSGDLLQEISASSFLPLIFVFINDDIEKCRTAAGELLKEIFKKANRERIQTYLSLMRPWIGQKQNLLVMRLGFMSYSLYFKIQKTDDGDVDMLLSSILEVLGDAEMAPNWELIFAALQLASSLCQSFPDRLLALDQAGLWLAIKNCLSYPHAWVKLASSRLMTIYFSDFATNNVEGGLQKVPLHGSYGLQLDSDSIVNLIQFFTGILDTPGLDDLLSTETIKSLLFLGQCSAATDLKWPNLHDTETELLNGDDSSVIDKQSQRRTAVDYLFRRLSSVLRRESSPPRAPILIPKTAALQIMLYLTAKLSAETILPLLKTILLPLHNLTDPDIPIPYSTDDLFKTQYAALRTNCQELMGLLQNKCGTAEYMAQLLRVRERAKITRAERSRKRKIEVVRAPERTGRNKIRKTERKRERRSEKRLEHREQRRAQL